MDQDRPNSDPPPESDQPQPGQHQPEQPAKDPAAPSPAPPKKKRHRRRWLKILGGVLGVLILLILLAPTLLSTAPVRRFVVNKINQNLNGTLQIEDWSLSWFRGASITGVRLFDAQGRQILEAPSLSTQLTPLKAIRGNYDFGQTRGQVSSFVLRIATDGHTNFQDLAKPHPKQPAPKRPAEPAHKAEPAKVPNISGNFVFDARGTVEREGQPALHVDKATLSANVPNINDLIEHSADVRLRVDGQDGTDEVSLKGSVDLFDNNRLKPAVAKETFTVKDVRLSVLRAFMPANEQLAKLGGRANGQIVADFAGNDGFVEGKLTVTEPSVGGFGGDVYTSPQTPIVLTIPRTSISAPQGLDHWQTARITMAKDQRASLTFAEGKFDAYLDTTPQAILNTRDRRPPGDAGLIETTFTLDKPRDLQRKLPNTLGIRKDITILQGTYTQTASLAMTAATAKFTQHASLKDLDAETKDQRSVKISPITLELAATLPDFTDVKFLLNSAFADAKIEGKNLASIQGPITADLAGLQQELGQIFDFGDMKLAGKLVDSQLTSKGDILSEGGHATLRYDGTIENFVFTRDGKTASEPHLYLGTGATLLRGKDQFLDEVSGAWFSALSGSKDDPTFDIELRVNANLIGDVGKIKPGEKPQISFTLPRLELVRLNANLGRAITQYGALLPEKYTHLGLSGRLVASGRGSYRDGVIYIEPGSALRLLGFDVASNLPAGVIGRQPSQSPTLLIEVVNTLSATRNDKYPIIAGTILTDGDIEPLMQVRDALAQLDNKPGHKPSSPDEVRRTLAGRAVLRHVISTDDDGTIRLRHDPQSSYISDLTVRENGRPAFSAPKAAFYTDISFKPTTATLWSRKSVIAFPGSDMLEVSFRGIIEHLDHDPTFKAFPKDVDDDRGFVIEFVRYDAKKLLPLMKALVPPDNTVLANLLMSGSYTNKRFVITGHFPLEKPFHEAIAGLEFDGGLTLDTLSVAGLEMRTINAYARADRGVITINGPHAPTTKPIEVNGGTMQVADTQLDLTIPGGGGLYIRPGTRLLDDVQVNPLFMNSVLGNAVPLFMDLSTAQSPLDITVEQWQGKVPLAWLKPAEPGSPQPRSDARAVLRIRMKQAQLGGGMLGQITDLLSGKPAGLGGLGGLIGAGPLTARNHNPSGGSILADIDGTLTIADGLITSDLPITINKHRFALTGSVNLQQMKIQSMNFVVPQSAVHSALPKELDRVVKGDVVVPFSGNLRTKQFNFDVMGAIQRSLVPGGKGGSPIDALPDLLRGLGGDRNKDKPKDRDKNRDNDRNPTPQRDKPRGGDVISKPRQPVPPSAESDPQR